MAYAELHASSAFSFLRGSSLPEHLVQRAAALGLGALALVDRDGLSGAPRFFKAARKAGIQLARSRAWDVAPPWSAETHVPTSDRSSSTPGRYAGVGE